MTTRPPIWRILPTIACLLTALGLALVRPRMDIPDQNVAQYVVVGEPLILGYGGITSYHLPAAEALAALLYSRWRIPPRVLCGAFGLLLAALLLALERILDARILLGLAPAVCAASFRWEYLQGFLSLFILVVAGLLIRYAAKTTAANALKLALAIGATFLFRSTLVLMPPAVALCALIFWLPDSPRERSRQIAVLLIVPYLFTLPVLQMNWRLHHRVVPFEDGEASTNIVTGALGLVETIEGPWRALVPRPDVVEKSGVILWAAAEVARHPLRYCLAYALRLSHVFAWTFPYILLALTALWLRRRKREFQALGLIVFYLIGIHCFMSVQMNYFTPLLPLLILLSCSLSEFLGSGYFSLPLAFSAGTLNTALAACLGLSVYAASLTCRAGTVALDDAIRSKPDDWWLLKTRAEERLRRGRFPEAIADFSRAAALMPDGSSIPYLGIEIESELAAAKMLQGPVRRMPDAQSADPAEPDPTPIVRSHLIRAYGWMKLGRPNAAAAEMQLARRSWDAACTIGGAGSERTSDMLKRLRADDFFLAAVEQILNEWPLANRAVLTAGLVSIYPRSVAAWILRADCLNRLGRQEEWRKAMDQAFKAGPTPSQRARLAGLYNASEDYADTLRNLGPDRGKSARALPGSTDADTLILTAQARAGLGQTATAIEALNSAVMLSLTREQTCQVARIFVDLEDAKSALAQLGSVHGPDDFETLALKARIRLALGQNGLAATALDQAASFALNSEQRRILAGFYVDAGDFKRALELIKTLPGPDDAASLIVTARARAGLGQRALALSILSKAGGMAADSEQKFELAMVYQNLKDYAGALAILNKLTEASPQNAHFLTSRAISEYYSGAASRAVATLVAAIKADPAFLPAYLTLGYIYAERRDTRRAIKLYKSALARTADRPADPIRREVVRALRGEQAIDAAAAARSAR